MTDRKAETINKNERVAEKIQSWIESNAGSNFEYELSRFTECADRLVIKSLRYNYYVSVLINDGSIDKISLDGGKVVFDSFYLGSLNVLQVLAMIETVEYTKQSTMDAIKEGMYRAFENV